MEHFVFQNTAAFQTHREKMQAYHAVLMDLPTIVNAEDAKGIEHAIKQKKESFSEDFFYKTADDFNYVASESIKSKAAKDDPKATGVNHVEKTFENFYGPLAMQSASLEASFLLGETNGLLQARQKALSTEAQGIIAGATEVNLTMPRSTQTQVDLGYVELYTITSQLIGKASAKIIDINQYIEVQEIIDHEPIKPRQTIKLGKLQTTEFRKFGACLMYGNVEQELTSFFTSIGGVNGVFAAFRNKMAKNKSYQAYVEITKKPSDKYVFEAENIVDAPASGGFDGFTDKMVAKTVRAAHNLQKGYQKLIDTAISEGVDIEGEILPQVHCVYNPSAAGSEVIGWLRRALARDMFGVTLDSNIIFHATRWQMPSGAWVAEKDSTGAVVLDKNKFQKRIDAFSRSSFGVMLVIPKLYNIFGINKEMYTFTSVAADTDTVSYIAYELFTVFAPENQRLWIKNLVPAPENSTNPLATGA